MGLQSNVWPRRDNFLKHCNNISSKNPISVSQHPTTAFKKKTLGSQTGKISSDSSTWTVTCCTSQTERPLFMARNGVTDEDLDRLRFDLIRCFRFSVSKDMAMIQNVYLSMFICLLWLHVYMMFKTNSMFICHLPCQNKRL
jgi:hypothetical protein